MDALQGKSLDETKEQIEILNLEFQRLLTETVKGLRKFNEVIMEGGTNVRISNSGGIPSVCK